MKKVKNAHKEFSYSSLKPIALSIALSGVGFTIFNYLLLEGDQKYILIGLTAFTSIVFFALWFVLRKPKALYNHMTEVMLLMAILPFFSVFTHMWLYNDPLQTSLILLLDVMLSTIIMNRKLLIGIISATTIFWFFTAAHFGFTDPWIHFIFSFIPTLMLAGIANTIIYVNFRNIQLSQEKEFQKNEELNSAKQELEKQSSELKLTISELEQAKEEVIRATKYKAQFLSAMSHELKTPLNAVIGLSRILYKNNPRKDQLDDLETLQFSADSLLSLINDLLDFSKMKAGKVRLEEVEFDIDKLLERLIHSFKNKASERGLVVKYELSNMPTTKVIGDPNRLTQVMNNLISNALKFTPEGEVLVKCFSDELSNEGLKVKIEVSDTGVGIPEDKIENIFEAFDQLHYDVSRKYGGTGLGLTICKKLVELMGGELSVKSKLGKGSIFYFTIPFKAVHSIKETATSLKLPNELVLTPPKEISHSFPKGFKVLLVDDNDLNVRVISKMLKSNGVQHEIVMEGSSACQLIQNKQYDLVLMDIQMPIMDGFEAAREIRSMDDEYFKNIPIIALTASGVLEVEDDVLEAGMNACVSKPIEVEVLLEKMKEVLETQKTA